VNEVMKLSRRILNELRNQPDIVIEEHWTDIADFFGYSVVTTILNGQRYSITVQKESA